MVHSLLRAPAFQIFVMTFLVFLGIMGLREGGYLEGFELDAYDWSLRLRPSLSVTNHPITLITITDQDMHQLGHWPVTDEFLAQALKNIVQQHPRTIGVDLYRDLEVPPGRAVLNLMLDAHPEILMVKKFGEIEQGGIPAPAILRGTSRVGFTDIILDPDGIVRRGLLFLDDGVNFSRSFSLMAALQYLEQEGIVPKPAAENPQWVQLGPTVFRPFESDNGGYHEADARGYQYLLDLNRGKKVFPSISFGAVLAGDIRPELFKDRIVLIGVSAQSVKDYFYTSQCERLMACPPIPGIELHGYMVRQLLRSAQKGSQQPIATYSNSVEAIWIGLWVLGGGLIGAWIRGAGRFSLAVVSGFVLLSGLGVIGIMQGLWIPFVPPALGFGINAMVVTAWMSNREKQNRTVLMSLFSRHVSPEVAQAVWAQRDQFLEKGRLRPQKLVVTTLFSDLEGFTTVAETMEPDSVLNWLNTYMDTMVQTITRYGGTVDDYHGDMIKADFGVFRLHQTEEDNREDATNAVKCAVAFAQEMRHINAKWQQQGLPVVRMRIGIHTGPVVVGSLGSAERLKFTTIGDTVNIASRLESFQKNSEELWDQGEVCRILIGETTKQYLDKNIGHFKEVGVITLQGKAMGVSAYKLCTQQETRVSPSSSKETTL